MNSTMAFISMTPFSTSGRSTFRQNLLTLSNSIDEQRNNFYVFQVSKGRNFQSRTCFMMQSNNQRSKSKPKPKPKPRASNKGLFGRLKDAVLRPIVSVPGSGSSTDLIECVFCEGAGMRDCDACKGSGKDSLGTCLMCDGETYLECSVCSGVGTVDKIRRGGTDDKNQYTVKGAKRK